MASGSVLRRALSKAKRPPRCLRRSEVAASPRQTTSRRRLTMRGRCGRRITPWSSRTTRRRRTPSRRREPCRDRPSPGVRTRLPTLSQCQRGTSWQHAWLPWSRSEAEAPRLGTAVPAGPAAAVPTRERFPRRRRLFPGPARGGSSRTPCASGLWLLLLFLGLVQPGRAGSLLSGNHLVHRSREPAVAPPQSSHSAVRASGRLQVAERMSRRGNRSGE